MNQTVDEARSYKKNRKLLEKGGYQDFCKIQIVMSSIMAANRKYRKRQNYIPVSFRIFLSSH